jgi:hypothetical protein
MKLYNKSQNFLGLDNLRELSNNYLICTPEKTVSYGTGTRNDPNEILKASHYVEFYDQETNRELCFEKGIATLARLNFNANFYI